jgi:hypothetical protein
LSHWRTTVDKDLRVLLSINAQRDVSKKIKNIKRNSIEYNSITKIEGMKKEGKIRQIHWYIGGLQYN